MPEPDTQVVEPDVEVIPSDDPIEPDLDNVPEPELGGEDAAEPVVEPLAPELLQRAQYYGLAEADLQGMDGDRLNRVFAAVDRRTMQPAAAPAPGFAPGMPPPQSAPMGGYTPLKIEFGEDLDESVMAPIKTVADQLNKQMQEIYGFRQQVQKELEAMNVLREFADVDHFVSGLGEEWKSAYGSGPTVDMDPQSAEFAKRLELFHGGKNLRVDAQQRRQRMGVAESHMRSHHGIHWDRIAEHERKKLSGKIDQRRKGLSERPVKGRAPAMSPRDEAIAAWKK